MSPMECLVLVLCLPTSPNVFILLFQCMITAVACEGNPTVHSIKRSPKCPDHLHVVAIFYVGSKISASRWGEAFEIPLKISLYHILSGPTVHRFDQTCAILIYLLLDIGLPGIGYINMLIERRI